MAKRKAKVVWLPQDLNNRLGAAPVAATIGTQSATLIATLTAPPLGATPFHTEFPIVKDFAGGPSGNVGDANATLADLEQSGYRLRRIVGKLGLSCLQGAAQAAGDGSIFHITCGFIIRRVNEAGQSAMSLSSLGGVDISPATLDNTMDPWIWRRSWDIADRSASALGLDPNVDAFRPSNYLYGGGVLDGPHVDAKTARIVGPEERLFLSVTVEGINGSSQGAPGAILILGDLRILGSMKSNTGNRRNASR